MKSVIKYLICLLTGISIYSCDYLDVVPDQIPTFDNVFSDRYMAEKFLATCYQSLPQSAYDEAHPGMVGALEMVYNKERRTHQGMLLGLGQNDRTTSLMNFWSGNTGTMSLYENIRNCNVFLDNIERVVDLPRAEKDRWIAEVKLIKAYAHFFMLTYYGPMCIVRESASVNESTQGVRVYRDKVDDCFAYVLELIDEVISSNALPGIIVNTGTELGRFTKPAAYAIKAKALVYWASPLFNGNTDYVNFLNHNNEPFFNQAYDQSRWDRAVEACKAALLACEENDVRLYNQQTDYIPTVPVSDTTRMINGLRMVLNDPWNKELIWTNNAADKTLQANCIPLFESALGLFPTTGVLSFPFSTVELFYTQNGVPMNEDEDYDYDNRFSVRMGDAAHRYFIQQGEQSAGMNFDREWRFYSSVGFDRGKWYGNSYKNSPANDLDCLYPAGRFQEYSAGSTSSDRYNATGYWPKKLVNLNSFFQTASVWYPILYPYPNMRYADLLLLTAEALNESKAAPDNEVYRYIDEVRARAGLEGVVDSWEKYASSTYKNKPTTKTGMRAIIQRERNIELACEGHYYFDSRRWKTAIREQNRQIQGWNVLATNSNVNDYYTVITLYTQKFGQRDYFQPIPESDFINNPQLIQNPGW
jgi:hypothetical protein